MRPLARVRAYAHIAPKPRRNRADLLQGGLDPVTIRIDRRRSNAPALGRMQ